MAAALAPLTAARGAALRALPLIAWLNLIQLVTSLALPVFMMGIFDIVLAAFSAPAALWLLLAVSLVFVLQSVSEAIRTLALQAAGSALARRLEGPALAATARLAGSPQPLRDLELLRQFVASPAAATLLDALWAPGFLVALLALTPAFAVYGVVVGLLLVLLKLGGDTASKTGLKAANQAAAQTALDYGSALRAAEAVAALGMLPALLTRWRRGEVAMFAHARPALARAQILSAAGRALKLAATAGMIALGAWLVMADSIGIGTMIAGTQILARLLAPIDRLSSVAFDFGQARAAWQRLGEALAVPAPRRDCTALPRPAGRLIADRVAYIPPGSDRPVLRGVSFELAPGEVVAVVGPSASGKSTLLRLVLGLEAPSAGTLTLDGYATALWERADFAEHVGYLPQHVPLIDATIAENIARLGPVDERAVIAAARAAGLHGLIAALPFGYATPLREAGFALSIGQRQRLGLARALYGKRQLVVLDEPDAALDAAGEVMLRQTLAELRTRGIGVLLATHRPPLAAAADRVLVLRQGLVERSGPPAEVLPALTAGGARPLRPVAGLVS
jgi:ATP-binding cassette subfamily C protein